MKSHLFAVIITTGCLANGQDAGGGHDKAALLLDFTPTAPKVLDRPFDGWIRVVWPKGEAEVKPESVRLNLMKPADGHSGHSPIDSPYLATTEDGRSYWGAFALRPKLPDLNKLKPFTNYKDIVDLLGAPTHLPFSGQTDDKWGYDMVGWRFFTPLGQNTLEVLEVSVARKIPLGDAQDNRILIESYSVSRGTLTKTQDQE